MKLAPTGLATCAALIAAAGLAVPALAGDDPPPFRLIAASHGLFVKAGLRVHRHQR